MKTFHNWMEQSSTPQKMRLVRLAKISISHLYQLASGNRIASVDSAAAIEKASGKMNSDLPKLRRGDVLKTCADCPYYKKCKD